MKNAKKLMMSAAAGVALVLSGCATTTPPSAEGQTQEGYATYDRSTVVGEAEQFFGEASAGLADVLNKVFTDQGRPQAYIAGEEASGAVGVGLRYGRGYLYRPGAAPVEVFWTGPSIGFDAGGNASKVFTLVYDLGPTDNIYHRYPGVDGSAYIVGGAGVNYQRNGAVVLAPVRTGVGLRTGINIGYLNYTREYTAVPF
ncbi:DUF1134 domain-containing protein [Parvularcula flava]|uniref:DUF1134 domain-containing protein n=1 Tax=Aquisalinus luteolus TaxID=1566827 RepID=A0A8J3ERN9_9PROT|nr:DUF1134 domain-containing protein [Aquisalinus luteolus]NHK28823.1 DUF1134 domain-containing protein [Aquisalinus luteolus]GGH99624.1 hypothetical protein GCM10011355_26020 [Aquisalinus luteolus]